jgi:hypothetical protein
MQVIIAFVRLEIRGEFVVVWNVIDFIPDSAACPPSDVVRLRLTGY